jgi:cbb3-type cytochrome oxidase maturation protein
LTSFLRRRPPTIFENLKKNTLSALFILIGISILVAGSFLAAFLWSVAKGQFDDDYTPSVRMLFDNELTLGQSESPIKITKTKKEKCR